MVYVPGLWPAVGLHEKTPLVLIEAPAGAPGPRVKVRACPPSGSVAVTVKVSVVPSTTCLLPIEASKGGLFTGVSVTVMVRSSKLVDDPSLTVTLARYDPGPWVADGVQENIPPVVIVASAGKVPVVAVPMEKLSVWAGRSPSEATAVKPRVVVSWTVLSPMEARTVGCLASATPISITSEAESEPSETITITEYVAEAKP